jgi:anti-sigma factor (TIGR02949 family)
MSEMTNHCAPWREQIAAFADRELAPEKLAAFLQHTQECPGCAAEAVAQVAAKSAVHRAGMRYAAPGDLRARVMRSIAQPQKQRFISAQADAPAPFPPVWAHWPKWAAVAAAAVLLVAGVLLVGRFNGAHDRQALTEFADLHVATLASGNPVEVVSSDNHTVKPWFQGRIPFAFNLPELKGSPFTLIGGRVAYFRQEPAAQLIFSYQKHMISVFILRDSPQLDLRDSSLADHSSSFNLRSWRENGLRYVAIGDVNAATVQQLTDLLQHAQ